MPSDTKGLVDLRRNTEVLEKAVQVIETDRKASLHEFATMSNQRREAIQRHGQMLLDQRVLSELDLD